MYYIGGYEGSQLDHDPQHAKVSNFQCITEVQARIAQSTVK